MTIRMLITGSRDWTDATFVTDQIMFHYGLLVGQTGDDSPLTLIHGACPQGADAYADSLSSRPDVRVERYPARWYEHDDGCPASHRGQSMCRRAGFRRNAEMVQLGADICLAFIMNNSNGAAHTAKLAEKAGILTKRFERASWSLS